jgi:hypothetical protein
MRALILSFGLMAISTFGATPIATVTSATPFGLDGHFLNAPGVTSFPLVLGDTVMTANGAAVLLFEDGSIVKLGANSSARIAGVDASPKVVLLGGALDYKMTPGSSLVVTNLDREQKELARGMSLTPPPASAAAPRHHPRPNAELLTDPRFLVSAAGANPASLLRLPPVSQHF